MAAEPSWLDDDDPTTTGEDKGKKGSSSPTTTVGTTTMLMPSPPRQQQQQRSTHNHQQQQNQHCRNQQEEEHHTRTNASDSDFAWLNDGDEDDDEGDKYEYPVASRPSTEEPDGTYSTTKMGEQQEDKPLPNREEASIIKQQCEISTTKTPTQPRSKNGVLLSTAFDDDVTAAADNEKESEAQQQQQQKKKLKKQEAMQKRLDEKAAERKAKKAERLQREGEEGEDRSTTNKKKREKKKSTPVNINTTEKKKEQPRGDDDDDFDVWGNSDEEDEEGVVVQQPEDPAKEEVTKKEKKAPSSASPSAGIGVDVGLDESLSTTINTDLSVVAPLSDEDKARFAAVIKMVGADMVAKLRSAKFQHRVSVFVSGSGGLDLDELSSSMEGIRLAFFLFAFGTIDPVMQVSLAAMESTAQFFAEGVLPSFLPEPLVSSFGTLLLYCLGHRIKDSNTKIRNASEATLQRIAEHTSFGQALVLEAVLTCPTSGPPPTVVVAPSSSSSSLIPSTFNEDSVIIALGPTTEGSAAASSSTTSDSVSNWKFLLCRMDLCSKRFAEDETLVHSLEPHGSNLAVAALRSNNEKVRKRGVAFFVELYKILGSTTTGAAPAAGNNQLHAKLQDVTPATLRLLKQEIDIEVCDATSSGAEDVIANTEKLAELEDLKAFEAERTDTGGAAIPEFISELETAIGVPSLRCIVSTQWKLRQRVLDRVTALLGDEKAARAKAFAHQEGHLLTLICRLCAHVLEDGVPAMQLSALSFTSEVVSHGPQRLSASSNDANTDGQEGGHKLAAFKLLIAPLLKLWTSTTKEQSRSILLSILQLKSDLLTANQQSTTKQLACSMVVQTALTLPKSAEVSKCSVKALVPRLELITLTFSEITRIQDELEQEENEKAKVQNLKRAPGASRRNATKAVEHLTSALPTDDCMKFAVASFDHSHSKARVAASNLILEIYKIEGNVVQNYLSSLRGHVLAELKERIAQTAKKDRTKTAPLKRLACIVQPIECSGVPPGEGSVSTLLLSPTKPSPPRPGTFDAKNSLSPLGGGGGSHYRRGVYGATAPQPNNTETEDEYDEKETDYESFSRGGAGVGGLSIKERILAYQQQKEAAEQLASPARDDDNADDDDEYEFDNSKAPVFSFGGTGARGALAMAKQRAEKGHQVSSAPPKRKTEEQEEDRVMVVVPSSSSSSTTKPSSAAPTSSSSTPVGVSSSSPGQQSTTNAPRRSRVIVA